MKARAKHHLQKVFPHKKSTPANADHQTGTPRKTHENRVPVVQSTKSPLHGEASTTSNSVSRSGSSSNQQVRSSSIDRDDTIVAGSHAGREGESTVKDAEAHSIVSAKPEQFATSSKDVSQEPPFMSLGSDSRLRTGEGEMRYDEDVADRNIDMYGSGARHISNETRLASRGRSEPSQSPRSGRRVSLATSLYSHETPESTGTSFSKASDLPYSLGTGIPTEGSLIDSILPHLESADPRPYDKNDRPSRFARDEPHISIKRKSLQMSFGGRSSIPELPDSDSSSKYEGDLTDLRQVIMDGPQDGQIAGDDKKTRIDLDGIVDLSHTENVDKSITSAPTVTHETVKPTEHEIIEERIYKVVHNHDVYHYIQPVCETEILPARHFVQNSNNELVEVSEDKLPNCTGPNHRWSIVRGNGERSPEQELKHLPQDSQPIILSDKTHMTREGVERRETTILHPPELEDMSGYDGLAMPVEFFHHSEDSLLDRFETEGHESFSHDRGFVMSELSESLPRSTTPEHGPSRSSKMPIPRKPIPSNTP